jgi:ABC-type uncharacterized transport system involved in gliding motility auxiliary subunit
MLNRILSIVGWIGTALVFGAVIVRFVKPEWDQYAVYAAWAGLAGVLLYTLGQWRDIAAFFSRRQARYGALMSVSVLIVLGILIAVNWLSARQNKRWDLTANQVFSLSDQTVKLLKGLDAPVKFVVFDRGGELTRYQARLGEYAYQSDKVSTEYIDIDKKPVLAKEYNIAQYGTIVVQYKDRKEQVTAFGEQELTGALIKVMTGEKKKVYFVQGHGEKDHSDTERAGYSTVAEALGRDNYAVEGLVLAQAKDVPADATLLIVAGPTTDFFPTEVDMLRRYLDKGGHVLALLDPNTDGKAVSPQFEALLREWGIQAGHDVVIDSSGAGQLLGTDASVPLAARYPAHAITQGFRVMTGFPLAQSMSPVPGGANGRTAQPIVETSQRSWAEMDMKSLQSGEVSMDADKGDKPGPVPVAVAVSATSPDAEKASNTDEKKGDDTPRKPETRVVAFGDSDFGANSGINLAANRDLFMNTVNWLAQQENLIAIRPKEPSDRRVTLTETQQTYVTWFALLIFPGLILASGIFTWSRRRA